MVPAAAATATAIAPTLTFGAFASADAAGEPEADGDPEAVGAPEADGEPEADGALNSSAQQAGNGVAPGAGL